MKFVKPKAIVNLKSTEKTKNRIWNNINTNIYIPPGQSKFLILRQAPRADYYSLQHFFNFHLQKDFFIVPMEEKT